MLQAQVLTGAHRCLLAAVIALFLCGQGGYVIPSQEYRQRRTYKSDHIAFILSISDKKY